MLGAKTVRFPHKDKGLYGERDFDLGQPVRVSFTGNIQAFDVHDSCMQIMTASGLSHFVFDADPAVYLVQQDATWPPKEHDVWVIGGKVWHADQRGRLVTVTTKDGLYGIPRYPDTVLHSTDNPPEMLFRFHV